MKSFLVNLILLVMLAGTGCAQLQTSSANRQNLTATEAKQLIETNKDVVVLDVRTPEEFRSGHVEGAVNLDFYAPDFEKKLAELNRFEAYLVYCASGNRSGKTAAKMEELKFENLYNSKAGFQELKSEGVRTR